MIYSKFGSKLTLISKSEDASGRLTVQATAEGGTDVRDYTITDLKADEGSTEINEVIAKLALKVVARKPSPRKNTADIPHNERQQSRFRRR